MAPEKGQSRDEQLLNLQSRELHPEAVTNQDFTQHSGLNLHSLCPGMFVTFLVFIIKMLLFCASNIWSNALHSPVLLENMLWSLSIFNTLLKYVTCRESRAGLHCYPPHGQILAILQ